MHSLSNVQHNLCLVDAYFTSLFAKLQTTHRCPITEANHPLKICFTTTENATKHTNMTTRQEGQVIMYDDAEDMSDPTRLLSCPLHHPPTVYQTLIGKQPLNITKRLPLKEI